MIKKIAIGADHAGVEYKQQLIEYLEGKGYKIINVGTNTADSVDYPVYAKKVCDEVTSGRADTGILICGTGIGMSMMANKQKGIRAAVCGDVKSAEFTRLHNDANVLCMGARIIPFDLCKKITDIYLATGFMGGKHKARIDMFEK